MANNRLKLTQTNVQRLIREHDGTKKVRHWDTEVPKLFLAITPNGCAAYKLQIVKPDGSKTDAKLIAANEGSPELARVMAMKELGRMALGEADLVTRKRITKEEAEKEKASTFAALSSRFMTTPEKSPPRIKQRTYDERERLLRVHILPILGEQPFRQICRPRVRELVRAIQAEAAKHPRAREGTNPGAKLANECQGVIRAVFNWAIEEELTDVNPATFRKLFKDTPDKRSQMPDGALKLMWNALRAEMQTDDERHGWGSALTIMLHALTLQRPAEIVAARRDQFDWTPGKEMWCIPAGQTKTNEVYDVPLSPQAASLFREALSKHNSPWVFPNKAGDDHIRHDGPKQRWMRVRNKFVTEARKIDETCPLDGVQLYDCRRLGRTLLVRELGVSPAIAEACINHAPDRSMRTRYDVGESIEDVRQAMELWGDEVERLVGNLSSKGGIGLPHRSGPPDLLARRFPRSGVHAATSPQ
ncbi:MAG: tyrosine-type recombinase/integrase [Alphaproteobacteria bacterium]|nr:tyrosine-type recombinase/integrase [Alphaproteobacteria bacterium]